MGESEVEPSPEKKVKIFSCQAFRQDIRGNEAFKSLKKFVSAAKNSDDVVYEYLEGGGSLHEILSLIDVTAKGDLTTALPVFEAAHLILLSFQSPDSKYHQHCVEGARIIIRSHLLTIKAMLSMNVTKQKRVALKLLTAIVTLHSSFASEIMNVISLTPTMITELIIPSSEKESVRKCFILFILSFLIDGNTTVLKSFLDKKGYLSSIIPGLKFDEASTVNLTLSLLEDKILKNSSINKTVKLKIFNTQGLNSSQPLQIIKSLFDLYDWKGLQSTRQLIPQKKNKVKEVEVNEKEKDLVVESIHSFLLLLCCSKKYGIAFTDKSMGTSEQLNNQLLLTAFESLADPLKNKKISEVLLKTIASCPDLMKPILLKLEPSFQPRNSKNWFEAIEFAENLIKEINPTKLLLNESDVVTTSQITKVAKGLCSPIVLLRVGKSGAQKSQPVEIRLASLKLTTTIWDEIQKLLSAFPKHGRDLKKSMTHHISKFLPDAGDLVELWHNLCDGEFVSEQPSLLEKRHLFLSVVLTSLQIIVECQADAVSSPLSLASDMLKHIEKEEMSGSEFNDIQVKIVQFVAMDLQSLTPDMELFEKSLSSLLRSSGNDSISLASKILASTGVFKTNELEVDVWLCCYVSLPEEYREEVVEYLIKSLRRFFDIKDSSGYLNINGISEDESEPETKLKTTITPLIFESLETLKSHSSDSPKKGFKATAFQRYLSDVIIHLQHFYTVNLIFYDYLKSYKKILSKPVVNYLKNWKSSALTSVDVDVFLCRQQLDLISWLSNENDSRSIRDVITTDKSNIFKLYSLFRVVVAYFVNKSANNVLSDDDVPKYVEALLFFLKTHKPLEEDDHESADVISRDLKNKAVFYKNSVGCLFSNPHLLNGFDVFQKKNQGATTVVVKVLMGNEIIKNYFASKSVMEPWKSRFLKQIKSKLKKNKSVDGVDDLESVLNFFDYTQSDAVEMIDLLIASDLSLFVHQSKPSMWTVILVKFIKIHCLREELSGEVINKLCLIMKHLNQENCSHLEVIDDCFVYLLRKHPQHLLLMENDFLDVMLKRTNITPATATLGKLLLNDPNKVKHFLKTVTNNSGSIEGSELIFPLLPALIMDEDPFLEIIKSKTICLVWKTCEIQEKSSSKLLKVLQVVYEKFGKEILRAMTGERVDVILTNMEIAKVLVKLFIDKKDMKLLKNEIHKGLFEPELLLEAVKKLDVKTITESFMLGLLTQFSRTIKNSKNVDEEVLWPKFCSIISEVIELNKDSLWEKVSESSEWKEFSKLALGYCFGSSKHPSLLKILRLLTATLFKSKEESKSSSLFFQMLISHSQFLNLILSKSPLKGELVELFYNLIEINPSEMSAKHVPILLASYTAGLSASDITLLNILRLYEKRGVGVSDYEPFVWGETAVSHYSIGTSPGLSLWQRFSMSNVLDLLDSQRMELSLKNFPIHRSMEESQSQSTISDSNIYDPAFLLPLFVNLLSPGSVVFCLPFIYKGALGYTVRALSSECSNVRITASVVLTRFYNHLEMSQNLKQKLVWMHFINCFRYGIKDLSAQSLPNITTLFFARMTLELSRHPAEMYLPLQNFLLAKPYFGFETIPEFLPLFHSSEVSYWKHREWLLQVLRDGTKTTLDLNIIFHSMALKVIFCFFQSQLCDNETKKLTLQVLERILRVDKSILVISEYSLLNLINSIDCNSYQVVLHDLIKLLSVSTSVIVKDINISKNKHTSLAHIVQVLNISMKLLPALKNSKSIEIFKIYIRMIFDCLVLFINKEESCWFKLNRNRLQEIIDTGVVILGESYNYWKYCKIPFYFRDYDENFNTDVAKDFRNSVFLFNMLADQEMNKEGKL